MTVTRVPSRAALLALALFCAATAHAHGDAPHGGPVKKEQKAWGIAGDVRPGLRTVRIRMLDAMRFTPDHIVVQEGETLRLVITNTGAVKHELVIGTPEELQAHAAMMAAHPDMQHEEPYMAHVPPKKNGELVWTFNRAGDFAFACLIAGHYQAGMVGTVKVAPASVQK